MRSAILSTSVHGGAGKAAYRLHKGLRSIGEETVFLCSGGGADDVSSVPMRTPAFATRVLRRLGVRSLVSVDGTSAAASKPRFEIFSDCRNDRGRQMHWDLEGIDVINLHWIARFIDLPSFTGAFGGRIPIIWTLHDMHPFTGGCHYSQNCRKFTSVCETCPQLFTSGPGDASARVFGARSEALAKLSDSDLHVVSPSSWLCEQADSSSVLSRFPKSIIPNGLDISRFVPIPRAIARQALGLPCDRQFLLFVAETVENPRKGVAILQEALRIATRHSNGFELITVGSGNFSPPEKLSISSHHLGRITDERLMSIVYSAADIFVIPSLEDNLPNTMIEAISCGTPVIGLPVGGIPDAVRPGVTGWLADSIEIDDFARAILTALEEVANPAASEQLRNSCREVAETEYSLEIQANRYKALFTSLL